MTPADDAQRHALCVEVDGIDPLDLLALPPEHGPERFFWSTPDGAFAIAAVGAAVTIAADGPGRLPEASRLASMARERVQLHSADTRLAFVGGFAFEDTVRPEGPWDGLAGAWFVLPRICLVSGPDGSRLTVVRDEPPWAWSRELRDLRQQIARLRAPEPWSPATARRARETPGAFGETGLRERLRRRIEAGLEAIADGEVDKIVLSATITRRYAEAVDPLAALQWLRRSQPDCYAYLVSAGARATFLGASPELLVRVSADRLWTSALAASAPRDRRPQTDAALGWALLDDPKERAEHRVVVDAIRSLLEDAGYDVQVAPKPVLRKLASIQHLETAIQATMPHDGDVLAEAARLHPTPALGGAPRDRALAAIARIEARPRGWYGGGVGWHDGLGDGELAVGIRCLLVSGPEVTAFAGAGILDGSDPDAEADEILLKLSATG